MQSCEWKVSISMCLNWNGYIFGVEWRPLKAASVKHCRKSRRVSFTVKSIVDTVATIIKRDFITTLFLLWCLHYVERLRVLLFVSFGFIELLVKWSEPLVVFKEVCDFRSKLLHSLISSGVSLWTSNLLEKVLLSLKQAAEWFMWGSESRCVSSDSVVGVLRLCLFLIHKTLFYSPSNLNLRSRYVSVSVRLIFRFFLRVFVCRKPPNISPLVSTLIHPSFSSCVRI